MLETTNHSYSNRLSILSELAGQINLSAIVMTSSSAKVRVMLMSKHCVSLQNRVSVAISSSQFDSTHSLHLRTG